jgi:glycosyltransferase involved in cell wall biosynthesis
MPKIGVIAQVNDAWGDCWQTRHHVVSRLSRYFYTVWMNPPTTWRELFGRRTPVPRAENPTGEPGFDIYAPESWLPAIHRPRWLAGRLLKEHLKRARRMLVNRGCEKIILASWRARFDSGWSDIPFDLRCYYVDDEYSFSPVETPIDPDEMRMLKEADQVFVTSRSLLEKKGWVNPKTFFVPNGVNYRAFATLQNEPPELAIVPRPRIGYAGFLKEQLDWSLLLELAKRHSAWSFVFVGPASSRLSAVAQLEDLRKLSNVWFLGAKPTSSLPAFTQNFDVCVMPYRRNDYTKYIYPLKLHEYLASGRPTVGARIRSLEEFSQVVQLACTTDDWSSALEEALKPGARSQERVAERQSVAKLHDWDIQVLKIASTLVSSVSPELSQKLRLLSAGESQKRPEDAGLVSAGARLISASVMPDLATSNQPPVVADSPSVTGAGRTHENASVGPVLLVSPWYRPAVGGVVEVAERLHRRLTDKGVETHLLIAHDGRGGIEASETTPRLWRLGSASEAFHQLSFKNLLATASRGTLAYWRLYRFVRSHKISTVVVLYPIGYSWLFLLLRCMTHIRLIASLHGNDVTKYDSYGPQAKWLIRQILLNSDAVTTCAEHLSRKAMELSAGKTLRIELIPNCVDTSWFAPPSGTFVRSNTRPTFVHVSNFATKKRTIDIIEAFADSRIPQEALLVMVGDGPDRARASQRAHELHVSDRVAFAGSQQDVRPFLWEADVFVLASDDEGAPLALLEAMACGLPYVSTAWGPAAMLPLGECGLVVPPHAPRLLAAAMAELIANPQACREMGMQARHRAKTDFREDKYVERHLDLLREFK